METQTTNLSQPSTISPGKWALYIFISGIPLVGFIMLLVWAFGNDNNITRQNWAKGMLLIMLIVIILYVLFFVLLGGAALLGGLGSEY